MGFEILGLAYDENEFEPSSGTISFRCVFKMFLNRQSLPCLVLNLSLNKTDKQSVPSTDNNSKQLGLPLYEPRRNPTVLATQEKRH